jgi:predicted kinase
MLALCPPSGHAVLVLALMGLPGAGKSTLAAGLAAATKWSILDRDQIRSERHPGDTRDTAREEADRLLLRRAGSGVRAALNLIVDGKTWARQAERLALEEAIEDAGGEVQWCWLDLPVDLACERVRGDSTHPAPDRDSDLVHRVALRFDPPPAGCWHLDARLAPEFLLREVLLRLATRLNAILIDDR